MSGSNKAGGRTYGGVFLLCAALAAGAGTTAPARCALTKTGHFLTYYRALEKTSVRPNFWNRVALSLALAKAERPDSSKVIPAS